MFAHFKTVVFQKEKRMWPLTQGTTLTCEPTVFLFLCRVSSSGESMWKNKSQIYLENMTLKISAQILCVLPPHPQAEGSWNTEKFILPYPLSQEKLRNKVQQWDQTLNFFFPIIRGSLFPQIPQNSAIARITCITLTSLPNPHRGNPVTSPWTQFSKAGLNSHKYTQEHSY